MFAYKTQFLVLANLSENFPSIYLRAYSLNNCLIFKLIRYTSAHESIGFELIVVFNVFFKRVPSSSGGINITTTFPSIPGYPLGSTCNGNCSCGLGSPVPICGTDGISYLTPCFAGCKIPVLTENPVRKSIDL